MISNQLCSHDVSITVLLINDSKHANTLEFYCTEPDAVASLVADILLLGITTIKAKAFMRVHHFQSIHVMLLRGMFFSVCGHVLLVVN